MLEARQAPLLTTIASSTFDGRTDIYRGSYCSIYVARSFTGDKDETWLAITGGTNNARCLRTGDDTATAGITTWITVFHMPSASPFTLHNEVTAECYYYY